MDPELLNAVKYEGGPVDVDEVMRRIRAYLAKKQGETSADRFFSLPSGGTLTSDIYEELYQANQVYNKLYVAPYLTPVKVPLVSGLWQRLRQGLHRVAIFYVNRLGEAQIRFNAHVVRVLNELVRHLDADATADKVERLERRVQELEKRLAAVEQSVRCRDRLGE
ncbi:MAG: hypothetical protein RML36_14535 [Anaerolineae bacterium]|nr:hypothetical protein [Anaerolineae bacterium]MDW8100687.1 hypothetical protein [Anaerolineae bacterium]